MRIELINRQPAKIIGVVIRNPIPLAFSVGELRRIVRFMLIESPLARGIPWCRSSTGEFRGTLKTRTKARQRDVGRA
jgi:hypothetical protein